MSSHPGKSYPTFQLKISEEAIYANKSRERLFGYAIEAPKGPINEPTFIASNDEALQTFGIDFAPHFYQKSGGLIITRVGLPNAKSASITYCIETTTTQASTETPTQGDTPGETQGDTPGETPTSETITKTYMEAFTVSTIDKGVSDIKVKVIESLGVAGGWTLIVDIPGITSRTFHSLLTFRDVVKTINNKFAKYLKAEQKAYPDSHLPIDRLINTADSVQELVVLNDGATVSPTSVATDFTSLDENDGLLKGGSYGQFFKNDTDMATIEEARQLDGSYDSSVLGREATTYLLYSGYTENVPEAGITSDFEDVLDENDNPVLDGEGNTQQAIRKDITLTASVVYKKAFDLMKNIDLLGVTTLSELDVVQSALEDHIQECLDPEVNILRFGITAFLDYNNPLKPNFTMEDVMNGAVLLNSEYFLYIGQGVRFKTDNGVTYDIPPHKATMLYTGIRSSLNYETAIFGGEDRKILKGVVDVLPIVPGQTLYRADREELNENGVITFKQEYDRVTFLEGVTTTQDSDVLSYENIMSIVIYITKRLVRVAKAYQGKKMTEDLKESLKTALTSELRTIQQTDNCLIAIKDEEYDIPPYDVEVESAAMVKFNNEGELVRQSKIVAKVKIVPIGALRDIDLGVIVI